MSYIYYSELKNFIMESTIKIISQEEIELVKDFLQAECGIYISEKKNYLIDRLTIVAKKFGCRNLRDLIDKAKQNPINGLSDKIVDAMTINETLWFRDGYVIFFV